MKKVTLEEGGKFEDWFDVIELTESKMAFKMGPDLCTYERVSESAPGAA